VVFVPVSSSVTSDCVNVQANVERKGSHMGSVLRGVVVHNMKTDYYAMLRVD
jgi:hypothetical protein